MDRVLIVFCKKCNGVFDTIELPVELSEFSSIGRKYPRAHVKQVSRIEADKRGSCECERIRG